MFSETDSRDVPSMEGAPSLLDQELSLNHKPTYFDSSGDDDADSSDGHFPLQSIGGAKSIVVLPVKNEEHGFVVQKDVEASLECHIPPSAADGRWSATLQGSSLVRGPVGCASGTLSVHYAAYPKTLLLSTGATFGDDANMTYACSYNSRNQQHQISIVVPKASEPRGLILQTKRNFRACVMSSAFSFNQSQILPDLDLSISSKTTLPIHANLSISGRQRIPTAFQFQVSPVKSSKTTSTVSLSWNRSWSLEMAVYQMLGTKHSWVGLAVQHSRRGLTWIFSFIRGDVTVCVPINLVPISHDIASYTMQGASLSILTWAIQEAVMELWAQVEPGEKSKETNREQNLLKKGKARTEAQQQKELMVKQANSRAKLEGEKAGLVIKKAVYWIEGGDSWDVTTQLQFWVVDSTLVFPTSSKRDLLGFYDVSVGSQQAREESSSWWSGFFHVEELTSEGRQSLPKLRVEYLFNDTPYCITISDDEALSLPSSRGTRITPNEVK